MDFKFPLYNYAGNPVKHYLVKANPIELSEQVESQQRSHHILLVDRSSSMQDQIEELKDTLLKLLTLEEYNSDHMKISLLSYASQGDLTTHFAKVPVSEVMKIGSPYREAIGNIKAGGKTCMSQALEEAVHLVDDQELTVVTLHSDGYPTDPSAMYENLSIYRVCNELKAKNVFVNTIAHSDNSDFTILSNIAQTMSGTCTQAMNIKMVYDALHQTSSLLSQQTAASIESLIEEADFQVFVSRASGKILGSSKDLLVGGCVPGDEFLQYKYFEVDQDTYEQTDAPVCGEEDDVYYLDPLMAFAYAQLCQGKLNTAKYALISSRDLTLLEKHIYALTNPELRQFALDLQKAVLTDALADHDYLLEYGMPSELLPTLDLIGLLGKYSRDLRVNLEDLQDGYIRRGVRRIPGTVREGVFQRPEISTRRREEEEYVQVRSFSINRNNATIDMSIAQPIDLVKYNGEEETIIDSVEGISLDKLQDYRTYTLVSDGLINVPTLTLKITSKATFRALVKAGLVEGEYEPNTGYIIDLMERPLVDFEQTFDSIDGQFDNLARLRALSSILSACTKTRSEQYTDNQLKALKEVFVTPSLNISFPTVYEYASFGLSKDQAFEQGLLETRVGYKVNFGSKDILNLSKIHSANKFLDSQYIVKIHDAKISKPKFTDIYFQEAATFTHKDKRKTSKVDELMKPLFDDFLGLRSNGSLQQLLETNDIQGFEEGLELLTKRAWEHQDEAIEILSSLRKAVDYQIAKLFRSYICPLVFYIGTTGLLPDELQPQALSRKVLAEKYPKLKPGAAEKDASFFELGNTIISIYSKEEFFSTTPLTTPNTTHLSL